MSKCPWCGTELEKGIDRAHGKIYEYCPNENCSGNDDDDWNDDDWDD